VKRGASKKRGKRMPGNGRLENASPQPISGSAFGVSFHAVSFHFQPPLVRVERMNLMESISLPPATSFDDLVEKFAGCLDNTSMSK
jgi:hypothetical protein